MTPAPGCSSPAASRRVPPDRVSFKLAPLSRRLAVPFDRMLGPLSGPVTDAVTSNRALVPVLDLTQYRCQIAGYRFLTFAGILNGKVLGVIELKD